MQDFCLRARDCMCCQAGRLPPVDVVEYFAQARSMLEAAEVGRSGRCLGVLVGLCAAASPWGSVVGKCRTRLRHVVGLPVHLQQRIRAHLGRSARHALPRVARDDAGNQQHIVRHFVSTDGLVQLPNSARRPQVALRREVSLGEVELCVADEPAVAFAPFLPSLGLLLCASWVALARPDAVSEAFHALGCAAIQGDGLPYMLLWEAQPDSISFELRWRFASRLTFPAPWHVSSRWLRADDARAARDSE